MPQIAPFGFMMCALALSACRGEPGVAGQSGPAPPRAVEPVVAKAAAPEKREFRVATYNAGLAVGVLKYTDERVEPLVRALSTERLDLLCVQEFWLEEHWQKLVHATAAT